VNDLVAEKQVLSSTYLRVECEDQLDVIFSQAGADSTFTSGPG